MKTFIFIWLGQFLSLIGSRLTSFGLSVWLYEYTGSVTQFGLLVLCRSTAGLVFSPIAGVFVDRWDRRWTMIIADFCSGLCTLGIAVLLIVGKLEIWHLYLNAILSAGFNSCQSSAYSAATTVLVPKEYLARASGLGSIAGAVSKFISPVLAGALLVTIGLPGIIAIDFATLFFALVPLLLIRFPELHSNAKMEDSKKSSFFQEAADGWNYLVIRPGLLGLLFFLATKNIFAGAFSVLTMPLILSLTSPVGLGLILSLSSLGLVVGSLIMSFWKERENQINILFAFTLLTGISIFVAGLRPSLYLFTISNFFFFMTFPIIGGLVQVTLQKKVPLELQGRVFSLKVPIASIGLTLGYAIAGPLDDNIFEPLMAQGGPLAENIGHIIGVGTGRGIGLLDIIMGAILILIAAIAYQYPRLRLLDEEIPDAIPDRFDAEIEMQPSTQKIANKESIAA
ncbi:MFS transporter [Spirulina sp. 06S082]|uniref:MFS transporter n=1 Tax=Spirulina sp. 06S082 TaxID=3110248 RepID=UPI002B1F80DE|nr:MFS transporter [Spirulina sp. 06S082]MEA5472296.1 MFS transporter [Spirulina sp. 06S082]